ncbi:MAG TPA: glycosyltransferase family 4 protein [Chloroflexota bacterium]|nr:glycosyltransferase family 4 protein [Chloroflexota bacterium]
MTVDTLRSFPTRSAGPTGTARARPRRRVCIVATHPIQYQSPWFRAMAAEADFDLLVLFAHVASPREQGAAGFSVDFDWDVPLLEGFAYRILQNVSRRPGVGSFSGLDTPEIGRVIEQGHFDAVIVLGWSHKSDWQAIGACRSAGTPVMVRGDSHLRTPRRPIRRVAKQLTHRLFIPRFDACLAVGTWSEEYFAAHGARRERIFRVPHAIDEPRFERDAARFGPLRETLRESWGFGPGQLIYLFAGKLIARKRPLEFIRAVGLAARQNDRVAGLVVGDGPLRGACEAAVRRLGAPVRFAGFLNQSQIAAAYVASDALVLTSDGHETWGLVANEAMFCGRPCVVSDAVGSGPDLIRAGCTGEVFSQGDVPALSSLLVRFASEPGRLAAMGRNARMHLQGYSITAATNGLRQALDAVSVGTRCDGS